MEKKLESGVKGYEEVHDKQMLVFKEKKSYLGLEKGMRSQPLATVEKDPGSIPSTHTAGNSQSSLSPVPGEPASSSGFYRYQTCMSMEAKYSHT